MEPELSATLIAHVFLVSMVLCVRAQFVVEEIMNDSILIALETYGLVGAQGEGTEAELNTDMNEMIAVRARLYLEV